MADVRLPKVDAIVSIHQSMDLVAPWLLVFDLDGTLIDSSLDLCLAVNAAMAHVNAPQLPHGLITGYVGDGAAMLILRALGYPGDLDSLPDRHANQTERFKRALAFFLQFYREHKLDNTHLYKGVLSSLQSIRNRHPDLPMAILTNKPVRPSREICDALGIASFFFANYGGDSFQSKKPDPFGLLHLMEEARVLWRTKRSSNDNYLPQNVVMVGDSATDVLTAHRAQARSLGCRYGLSPHTLELVKPDLQCDSPAQWPTLLSYLSTEG